MVCGIIAKFAKGCIICINVQVCYKLITLLLFHSLPAKASHIKPCILQIQTGCSLISILASANALVLPLFCLNRHNLTIFVTYDLRNHSKKLRWNSSCLRARRLDLGTISPQLIGDPRRCGGGWRRRRRRERRKDWRGQRLPDPRRGSQSA